MATESKESTRNLPAASRYRYALGVLLGALAISVFVFPLNLVLVATLLVIIYLCITRILERNEPFCGISGEYGLIFFAISGSAAVLLCVGVLLLPFASGNLIPVGWDTGRHLYWARLFYEGDFLHFWIETGGNSFLVPVIIACLSKISGIGLFYIRIGTELLYAVSLVLIVGYLTYRATRSHVPAGISMLFSVSMISLYRVSADLHRTLLATIFLLLLVAVYTSRISSKVRHPFIAVLSALIALSQIEVGMLVAGICVIFEVTNRILNLETRPLQTVIVFVGLAGPLLFAASVSTHFLEVMVSYETALSPPSIDYIVFYMGGLLFSFFPVSLVSIFIRRRTIRSNRTLLFVAVFTLAILLVVVIPSYFLAFPTIFRKMASRSVVILPLPVLYASEGTYLAAAPRVFRKRRPQMLGKTLVCVFFASVISLSAVTTASNAPVHLHAFVSDDLIEQLVWLSNNVAFENTPIFLTKALAVYSYKDDGWIGAFQGHHFAFNGPLIFLLFAHAFPSNDISTSLYNERLLANIRQHYDLTLAALSSIPIVILGGTYGSLLDSELNCTRKLTEGIYVLDITNPQFTTRSYSIGVSDYFVTSTGWYYSTLDGQRCVVGKLAPTPISRTYAGIFNESGDYTISLRCRTSGNATIRFYVNETLAHTAEVYQLGAEVQVGFGLSTTRGIGFIRYELTGVAGRTIYIERMKVTAV